MLPVGRLSPGTVCGGKESTTATAAETTTATTKTVTTATSSKPKSPNVENGHITSAPAIGPGADPGSEAAVQKKNCEWLEVQVMGLANEG